MARPAHLGGWTGEEVHAECQKAYSAYRRQRTEQYKAYFSAHQEFRDPHHPYKARDLTAALPEDWADLADEMPVGERHVHHLSGLSSQVLALGLLGVGRKLDPTLAWLDTALGRLPSQPPSTTTSQFEYTLAPEVLGERPRQTSVDFFVDRPVSLMCVECKWTEAGLGSCSCSSQAQLDSGCSERVLGRDAYWRVANELFHLPKRNHGAPCPLSFTYQAVRNVAAAQSIAHDGQLPVFGLIYDDENPYFTQTGEWPGWPAALDATVNGGGGSVLFRAVSWQQLIQVVPLDARTRAWAAEKHGLGQAGR